MSQNYSASDSDSDSAATNRAPPRRYNRRAFSRTFVHLEKRLKAAPSKNALSKLKDMGRVKEIAFTKNHSSAEIKQLLTSHFPTMGNLDMARWVMDNLRERISFWSTQLNISLHVFLQFANYQLLWQGTFYERCSRRCSQWGENYGTFWWGRQEKSVLILEPR